MPDLAWPIVVLVIGAAAAAGLGVVGQASLSARVGAGAICLALLAAGAALRAGSQAGGPSETWRLGARLSVVFGLRLDSLSSVLVIFVLALATVAVVPLLFQAGSVPTGLAVGRWPALLLLLASTLGLLLTTNALVLVALWGLSASLVALALLLGGYPWAKALRLLTTNYLGTLLLAWAFVWLLRTNGENAALFDLSWAGVPAWVGLALAAVLATRLGLFPFHGWIGPLASSPRSLGLLTVVAGMFVPGVYLSARLLGLTQPPALEGLRGLLQVLALISLPLLALQSLRAPEPTRAAAQLLMLAGAGAVAGLASPSSAGALAGLFFAVSGPLALVAWLLARTPVPIGDGDGQRWVRLASRLSRVLAALSLAGLPLTGGFVAFWLLHSALAEQGQWLGLVASLSGHLLALVAGLRLAWLGAGPSSLAPAAGNALAVRVRAAAAAAGALVLVAFGVVPRAGALAPLLGAAGTVSRLSPENLGLVPRGLLVLGGAWYPIDILVWTVLTGGAFLILWRWGRAGAPAGEPIRPRFAPAGANLAEEFAAPLRPVLDRAVWLAEGAGAPRLLSRAAALAATLAWRGFAVIEGRYAVPAMILAALALLLVLGR